MWRKLDSGSIKSVEEAGDVFPGEEKDQANDLCLQTFEELSQKRKKMGSVWF